MHPVRRQRLFLVLFIVIVASVGIMLMLKSLGTNLNLFYSPTQIQAGEAPRDVRIRAGGMVVKGSVERASDSLFVSFEITDGPSQIEAHFTGILPDLFAESEAAVVAGMLDANGVLQADEVLAKHDETYMPREVADAMEKGHEWKAEQDRLNGEAKEAKSYEY